MSPPRILMLIGSGEMAAPVSRAYRLLVDRLVGPTGHPADVRAVIVDTPYRFQENAADLSAELIDFFARRIGLSATIAAFGRSDEDVLVREAALEAIRQADFVFSGPGSPSYAVHHWSESALPAVLTDKLERGGVQVFASAAALTMGRLTVPIYEIYKGGADSFWLDGLDVLGTIGIQAAVLPHFDNGEGEGHDTRFCFLGERRLRMLEERMPVGTYVLGIDEHTALMLDLDEGRALVLGRGKVTIREGTRSTEHATGAEIPLSEFQREAPTRAAQPAVAAGEDGQARLARRVLQLEKAEAAERARAGLVEPLLAALLELRRDARQNGDYAGADAIRARLATLGVELTDTADGTTQYRLPD